MSQEIGTSDLKDGDVLLYHGDDLIGRAIRFFDDTDVNHAGIYLGAERVGEAVASGLAESTLDASVSSSRWVRVRRRKPRPQQMDPVLNVCREYLDRHERYAYEEIVLLAFLCLGRELTPAPSLRALLRAVLDRAAHRLLELADAGREPMICSEFVYRAYDEALPAIVDEYSLSIDQARTVPPPLGTGARLAPPAGPTTLMAWVLERQSEQVAPASESTGAPPADDRRLRDLVAAYLAEAKHLRPTRAVYRPPADDAELQLSVGRFADAHAAARRRPVAEVGRADALGRLVQAVADFVTPGDLNASSSLESLGLLRVGPTLEVAATTRDPG